MNWWLVVALVVVVLVFALYLSNSAGRLDRLHRKIDTARLSLDAHLLRRSSVAVELSTSGVLDPATSLVLADAAHRARTASDADDVERGIAESELTEALDAVLDDPEDVAEIRSDPLGCELLDELDAAARRVELSRRFLNDAVRACRQVRGHRIVRWLRLAGHTSWPQTFEMDDTLPRGLGSR